jgi:D-amino-acid dehydrogenase
MSRHVVVIGAGIVGAACAWELVADGYRVTIIEPESPGGPQAASYGNGAWISPASVVPMSMPGLWRNVPGYLLDPDGPLTIRWPKLPRLLPWLVRFLLAGSTVPRVEATARALSTLLHDAPERHAALAAKIGRADLIRQNGLLYAYFDRNAFEAEALSWRLRRDNGVTWTELDTAAMRAKAPQLDPRYRFGILVEAGAHCVAPGAFVAALVEASVAAGASLRRTAATGFDVLGDKLRGVTTREGTIACDAAVIASGIRSKALARAAGDAIPLESERGYHAVVTNTDILLSTPIMPADGRMANTSTTAGLRFSGQVELADVDAAPNWDRVEALLRHALRTYPTLGRREDLSVEKWLGHRPSTPDGKPVLGRASKLVDVVHAFGHGHIGLAAGPITGRIVADIVSARAPGVDIEPFSPSRFRWS